MENIAAYMTGLRSIEIKKTKTPKPKNGEVLVRVEYVGICGSDVHFYEAGRLGNFIVEYPFILGHECSGIIEVTGTGVKN